jgi:sulfatase modifying factor 1
MELVRDQEAELMIFTPLVRRLKVEEEERDMLRKNSQLLVALALCAYVVGARAGDVDGDGVDDAIDVCNNTPPGICVDAQGRPLGDIDLDCDTDMDDFALFQQGFTGPLVTPVIIETVTVGNPGNPGEWSGESYGGDGPDRVCGAVSYAYRIGKYEVTAEQYAAFLNAVAADDVYDLYNVYMDYDADPSRLGCNIKRHGFPGSYTYDVTAEWANRPVNWISWGDAARFCNWLHNGQPTGSQGPGTTEEGSYCLNGATSDAELLAVTRNPNATWVVPTEDEWYKAAYHKNDGVTGNYFDYPTSSDSMPSNDLLDPDPGNNANFDQGPPPYYTIGAPYWRTESGEFENSDSPYGTFDQGGNVWEWNEAILTESDRGLRGGSFWNWDTHMRAAARGSSYNPSRENTNVGFRVAKVD